MQLESQVELVELGPLVGLVQQVMLGLQVLLWLVILAQQAQLVILESMDTPASPASLVCLFALIISILIRMQNTRTYSSKYTDYL